MITKQAAKVADLRRALAQEAADVRDDKLLSQHGRRVKITELHAAARATADKLRAEETADLSAEYSKLEASLWGGAASSLRGSDLISWRHAAEKAAALKDADAADAALHRALDDGDEEMATAIARRAVDRSWRSTFGHWQDARRATLPMVDDIVGRLAELDEYRDTTSNAAALLRWSIPVPIEARGSLGAGPQEPGKRPLNSTDARTPGYAASAAAYDEAYR